MSTKKKSYQAKPFESTKPTKNTSANIFTTMMTSEAWKHLTGNQKALYLHMKERMYGQPNKTRPDPNNLAAFTFPKRVWCNLFGLYSSNNQSGFERDRDALIEHGFIICIEIGKNTRKENIYEYSDRWQYWTEEHGLDIPPEHMSASMLNKLANKANRTAKINDR